MAKKDELLTKEEFSEAVEAYARDNGVTIINSIIEMCDLFDIEIDNIPKIITSDLKEKIALCGDMYNTFYGKTPQLPLGQ